MALKKSQLYSSLWKSCDELRGGMDASQYKDYVLTLLFVKYVSDKYAGDPNALIMVPEGGSFADMVKLKGDKINMIIGRLAEKNIKKVKRLLKDNTRDLLLFTMGINNGLRISDLLKLKVGDVRDIKPGNTLKVKETKTGKMNFLMINKSVHKVLKQYLEEVKPSDEDYLFQS